MARLVEVPGGTVAVSATSGPRRLVAGRASGFSHDAPGAALAATSLAVQASAAAGPAVFEPTITEQCWGDTDTQRLRARLGAPTLTPAERDARRVRALVLPGRRRQPGRRPGHGGGAGRLRVLGGPGRVRAVDADGALVRRGLAAAGPGPGTDPAGEHHRLPTAGPPMNATLVAATIAAAPPSTAQPPPAGCGTFDLQCQAGQAANSAFASIVTSAAQAASDMVVASASWWVQTASVDPTDAAVLAAQAITRPLIGYLLVGSVLVQAIRLIISRRAEPLLTLGRGVAPLRGGVRARVDGAARRAAGRGRAARRTCWTGRRRSFAFAMRDALTATEDRLFVALLVAVVALVLAMIQWVLMAFREAGLLVLAAMLPLAAAGPRAWLYRLLAWLLAIVVYKPAAAFIYYIGFTYLSTTSSKTRRGRHDDHRDHGAAAGGAGDAADAAVLRLVRGAGRRRAGGGGGDARRGRGDRRSPAAAGRAAAVTQAGFMDSSGPGSAGEPPGRRRRRRRRRGAGRRQRWGGRAGVRPRRGPVRAGAAPGGSSSGAAMRQAPERGRSPAGAADRGRGVGGVSPPGPRPRRPRARRVRR